MTEPSPLASRLALIGNSSAITKLRARMRVLGPHVRAALIQAEPGLDPQAVALELHRLGSAAPGPFVSFDARELNTLAAQGVQALRAHLLTAQGGSVHIRAVAALDREAQEQLLHLVQAKSLLHSVKLIASADRTLAGAVSAHTFSSDLHSQLAAVTLVLPPLAERMEDLPELVEAALLEIGRPHDRSAPGVDPEAMRLLCAQRWPGGLTELVTVLSNASALAGNAAIGEQHLRAQLTSSAPAAAVAANPVSTSLRLQDAIDQHVRRVLEQCGGNKLRAAELLEISRSTLYRMLDSSSAERSKSAK